MTTEKRTCQNCKKDFQIEPEDFVFYDKIKVSAPTFCPECRLMRRLAWRNERSLHARVCDKCGKPMISVFSPETGLTVYCQPCWWSDSWDPMDYGVEYDPQKPFILQVVELFRNVPVMGLFSLYPTLINSEYTNMVGSLKDCYLLTYSDYNENCSYGASIIHSKDCFDNLMLENCELCYESINCRNCYKTWYSLDCQNCQNVFFSRNCVDCTNCFGCVNLRNKNYCFFNEQLTKDEYERKVGELSLESQKNIHAIQKNVEKVWNNFPQKYIHSKHSEHISGDYIYNSKDTFNSYLVEDAENCKYCSFVTPGGLKDSYDFTNYGAKAELLYEALQVGDQTFRIAYSWFVISSAYNIEYSMFIVGSHDLFGSVGLRKKEYCILNKQYSKNEYGALKKAIIEDMGKNPYRDSRGREYRYGEFFPIELSPFSYNETALEYYPLAENKAKNLGYKWFDFRAKDIANTSHSYSLPENIHDTDEKATQYALKCSHAGMCNEPCSGAFKITSRELKFHKDHGLALAQLCPSCRHYRRAEFRNKPQLYTRKCVCHSKDHGHSEKCAVVFETTYAPDRPEIVYCETCYQKEVV
ncbi:hypothetical protein HY620_03035 [Candidatus Uhrbacteria bacterium]|nr:hypothetical protein [Candidatus Uhrbacteria bacterium]